MLELFLSVKVRPDNEIDEYNLDDLEQEKEEYRNVDGYTLIDMIKSNVEELLAIQE